MQNQPINQQTNNNNATLATTNPNGKNPQFPEIRKRRDAVRLLKVHESNGHEFIAKFFSQFTFCSFCAEFLW